MERRNQAEIWGYIVIGEILSVHYQTLPDLLPGIEGYQRPACYSNLSDVYSLLQKRAANICDEQQRGCTLNNVAVNREIVEKYEKNRLGTLKT